MGYSKRSPHFVLIAFALLELFGCSSASLAPSIQDTPQTPQQKFTNAARHPDGLSISDVRALFRSQDAPTLESQKNCDFDYQTEMTIARNREELFMTLPEHIKTDPLKYHWCFYAKILELEDEISNERLFVDEINKIIIRRYPFLVHVARIFLADFEDPRYLEFANHNYKRLKNR